MAQAAVFSTLGFRRSTSRNIRVTVLVSVVLIFGSFAAAAAFQIHIDRAHSLPQADQFEARRHGHLAAAPVRSHPRHPPPGQPSRLNDAHRAALAGVIESGPIPAIHGVVRWRIIDLCQWVWDEFQVSVAKQTLSRELRAMGYRKLSARPRHHAQAEGAIEHFKKVSRPFWTRSRGTTASIRPT